MAKKTEKIEIDPALIQRFRYSCSKYGLLTTVMEMLVQGMNIQLVFELLKMLDFDPVLTSESLSFLTETGWAKGYVERMTANLPSQVSFSDFADAMKLHMDASFKAEKGRKKDRYYIPLE